jgi:ABC-type antimicrobial peptide transport system permease subunit
MVNQRVREIGVRMAMGAAPVDMRRATLRSGAWLVAAGVAIGVPAALAFASALQGLLFGVSSADPIVFLAVSAGLATIGMLACWLPARRAARLSPVEALRAD